MKTYVFYEKIGGKIFSHNLKATDIEEALEIAERLGYELVGEKIGEAFRMRDVWAYLFKRNQRDGKI